MAWWSEVDSSWTLFLDRDGVINQRKMNDYVISVEEFKFLPGAIEAICFFTQKFNEIIVVTNQQGIGKKIMTERNVNEIHRYMCREIEKAGGKITACYVAPELKNDEHSTRKPKPNMALKAQYDFPSIDFQRSIMVGDTDTDILFGKNLGMKTVRIRTEEPIGVEADLTVESLKKLKEIWEN